MFNMHEGLGKAANGREWKVAGYARVSREDHDAGESNSIQSQRALIDDWARSCDRVELVAHYTDDGYSGATFDRPGFSNMIADAENGLFDTIVVKDLSRFGRSYLDCGNWIERDLPRLGVRLFSITDDFDNMRQWNYDTALLFPMKNLINEMQVITTSQKVRTCLAVRRQQGEMVGNFAPYGYMKDPDDKHRLVVEDGSAQVVRRIFEDFAADASASAIARELNTENVPSPSAWRRQSGSRYCTNFGTDNIPKWHAQTVLRILRNEVYTGTLVQGRTQRVNWRMRDSLPVPESDWARCPETHEPIVSIEVFEQVKGLLERFKR